MQYLDIGEPPPYRVSTPPRAKPPSVPQPQVGGRLASGQTPSRMCKTPSGAAGWVVLAALMSINVLLGVAALLLLR